MANCELSIELDEPDRVYVGGEPIKGTVVVRANQAVTCKGLEVSCYWTTHGRGNIDRGEIDSKILSEGSWEANQKYRYPFEINSANWPPTYYGTYLNVSQMIEARAKLPWATDPKDTVEVTVAATAAPEDLTPVDNKRKGPTSIIWTVIGTILGLVLVPVVIAMLGMALLIIVPIALIGGGLFWFYRVFLPSRLTGPVELNVAPLRLAAGDALAGRLRFTPPRNLPINAIHWKVTAKEICSSGSGSNRSTHKHQVFEAVHPLAAAGKLPLGMPQSFEFTFPVPQTAPPSLKFTDNELLWEGELRIDIPGWPDWVRTIKLTVTPPAKLSATEPMGSSPSAASSSSDLSFDEVAKQILLSLDDPQRRRLVIDAVSGQTFALRVDLEGPLPDFHPFGGGTGDWLLAEHRGGLKLALLWPDGAIHPHMPVDDWQCAALLTGYDESEGRVLLQVTKV